MGLNSYDVRMKINSKQKTIKGPKETFTGKVKLKFLFDPTKNGRVNGAEVVFSPGARSAWHTHPYGQTLVITSGKGWVQTFGEHKHLIKKGDVVQSDPKEKHWHGATDKTSMTHLAIQEVKNGKGVEWMELVTDQEYHSK